MMRHPARLPPPWGSRIDRTTAVQFTFEGDTYFGYAGDTIASALAANGRLVLSRSFKYHRPRGPLTMAGQDSNTLVQVGHEPNVHADCRDIKPGLSITGQNYSGTLDRDRNAILDRFSRFLPVGFYYRDFWGPTRNAFLKFWEPMIRRRTGLGRVSLETKPMTYDKEYRFTDVLVIGGGPAGLSAALTAAKGGGSVVLVDENADLGGSARFARPGPSTENVNAMIKTLRETRNVTVMTGAVANGWYADHWIPVVQNTRMYKIRAREVIVASGSMEQPVPFRNNDLPGIMQSSAAQRLIRLYGVRPGKCAVVLTCNSQGYEAARDLIEADVEVAAIADARSAPTDPPPEGVTHFTGSGVSEARGDMRVSGAWISAIEGDRYSGKGRWVDCDLLCIAGGYVPSYHLPLQGGGKLQIDDATGAFSIRGCPEGMHLAGSVAGAYDDALAMEDGGSAAEAALVRLTGSAPADRPVRTGEAKTNFDWPLTPHPSGKDFIDFDEDIQVSDIENTVAEGYSELELVKRFSTVGMGPSQGRHSALATARLVARQTGRQVSEVGVTTARPPVTAEKLGVLAGSHPTHYRRTPMHFRHLELGAKMQPVGAWWRPSYYGEEPERTAAIEQEVAEVRNGVGMLDISTLGSLEVRGPDAAKLLNRLYTMRYDTQPIGTVRYLLLANEMGSIIDDGIAYRIADDQFYVTSTTGAAGSTYQLMLFWNAQWRLLADVTNATAVYSGVNVSGPKARKLLSGFDSDIDFSKEAFGYLQGRIGKFAGLPVRVMRIGFTGELSYEIHTPYRCGETLWDALMSKGGAHGLRPYGLEASRILRLEKGHIIVGQDTDAMTTPEQVSMTWALSKGKDFYLGKRSMDQRSRLGMDRRLVGFEAPGKSSSIAESCLVMKNGNAVGFVTSTCHSPTLGKRIGLAYAAPETQIGDKIQIRPRGSSEVQVKTVPMHFYDPGNARQEL